MMWLDDSFFKLGAFLTDISRETVTLGKGGTIKKVPTFGTSSGTVFYLKDFYSNDYLAYYPAETLSLTLKELHELSKGFSSDDLSFDSISSDDDTYKDDFKFLKDSLSSILRKVVLVSREDYKFGNSLKERKNFFLKALTFGTGLPYGFWMEDYGVIGSTPEILFSIIENKLKTFALAGTSQKGLETELLNSEKDKIEHGFVVKDIEEKLQSFSSEIKISPLTTVEFKNLIHLKTDIQAKVPRDINLKDLTNKLSPTAALGGYPQDSALRFLKETSYRQKYPDRYFGSAFGITSPEKSLFIVMIRNVQWNKDHLYIESGGGVVATSVLEKELEEINLKRNVIKKHYL